MAKLLKLRRGTTTQHGSFTGAEGEVTIDTTKDTAVVHDGSTAGGTPLAKEDLTNVSSSTIAGRLSNDSIAPSKIGSGTLPSDVTVASANLVDGTIVNADVNASAAIAGTKISPDFGSQNITTTGSLTGNGLTINSTFPQITLNDTDNNSDFSIYNGNGFFRIFDDTNSASRFAIASDGTVDVTGNLNVGAGIDVTGATTTQGIQATGNLSITNAAPQISLVDSNNNSDFQFKLDGGLFQIRDTTSDAYRIKVASDGTVDIGQNLNANGGVDVTGNITVTGTVDGRDVAADGTKLDGIESGATADQTAAEIRSLVASASDSNVFTDAKNGLLNGLTSTNGALKNGVSATTQAQSDNGSKVATTAYVRTAISNAQAFPSGTVMLFAQTSAPTGWTKSTSHNNKALRVVSGSVSSGGNQTFSTVFASRNLTASAGNTTATGNISVGNTTAGGNVSISNASTGGTVNSHTLSTSQMPSHSHHVPAGAFYEDQQYTLRAELVYKTQTGFNTSNTGGGGGHSHGFTGGSHNHTGTLSGSAHNHNASFSGSAHNHSISVNNLDMQVQYVDVILATKD